LSPEALAFFFIVGGLAAKNKRSLLFIFVFIVGFVLFLSPEALFYFCFWAFFVLSMSAEPSCGLWPHHIDKTSP
jgi:hypothetical protein